MPLRFEYSSTILGYKAGGTQLIYLDETQIGKKIIPSRFWQLKAQVTYQMKSNLTQSCTVLGAISDKGYLAFQIIEGTVNSEIYKYHLRQLVHDIKKRCSKKVVIILDNAPIHTAYKVKINELKDIPHESLPPQTPEFNPIELYWGILIKSFQNQQLFIMKTFSKLFMNPQFCQHPEAKNLCDHVKYLKKGVMKYGL